jgi:hypothetical protein
MDACVGNRGWHLLLIGLALLAGGCLGSCRIHGSAGDKTFGSETIFGKTIAQYCAEAAQAIDEGDWISARVLLTGSQRLYQAAKARHEGIAARWEALEKRVQGASKLPIAVDTEPAVQVVEIQGVPVGGDVAAILPKVNYVNPGGVDDGPAMDRLATRVHAILVARYPTFTKHFPKVVYTAFAEPPIDPGKTYVRWGTTIDLPTGRADPAKR